MVEDAGEVGRSGARAAGEAYAAEVAADAEDDLHAARGSGDDQRRGQRRGGFAGEVPLRARLQGEMQTRCKRDAREMQGAYAGGEAGRYKGDSTEMQGKMPAEMKMQGGVQL